MTSENPVERLDRTGDYVAAGGWRRGVVGFLVGLIFGALVALTLPRDSD